MAHDAGGKTIKSPFSVVVDTRESRPYTFSAIYADAAQKNARIEVPTIRACLSHGDYSLFGLPRVSVERKSKSDLFASVIRRENFIGRLERMSAEQDHSAVVVEAEISEIMRNPPAFTKYKPKSLMRTILRWSMDYPVKWWFLPDRAAAEIWTYRILDFYYRKHVAEVSEAICRKSDGSVVTSRPISGVGEGAARHEETAEDMGVFDWGGQLWPEFYPDDSTRPFAVPLAMRGLAV